MSFRNIFQTRHYFFFIHLILLLKLDESQIDRLKIELSKWNNNFNPEIWDREFQKVIEVQD